MKTGQNVKMLLVGLVVLLSIGFGFFCFAFATPWLGFVNGAKVLEWANCPIATDMKPFPDCGNYVLNKFYYITYGWLGFIGTPFLFLYAFWDVLLVWILLLIMMMISLEHSKT